MGRPAMGRAARALVMSTKGTAQERERLIEMYGSVYVGLRLGLDLALGHKPENTSEIAAPDGAKIGEAEPRVVDKPDDAKPGDYSMQGPEDPGPRHRHRRGQIIDTTYEAGTKHLVYACAHEGCTERITAR